MHACRHAPDISSQARFIDNITFGNECGIDEAVHIHYTGYINNNSVRGFHRTNVNMFSEFLCLTFLSASKNKKKKLFFSLFLFSANRGVCVCAPELMGLLFI